MPAQEGPPPWLRRLYLPAYRVSETARYARTYPQTVAYWHYRGGGLGSALPGRERRKPLSYLQVVEVAFVATFRRLGVSLQRIRKARDYFAQRFEAEYPFAQLELKTDGHHVLMEMLEVDPDPQFEHLIIIGDAAGQLAWKPLVVERFLEFDYEYNLAMRWHLAGRQSRVLIDPRISFGAPTIRGIPTWALKGRSQAGESIQDISADFGLEPDEVREALTFEGIRIAARFSFSTATSVLPYPRPSGNISSRRAPRLNITSYILHKKNKTISGWGKWAAEDGSSSVRIIAIMKGQPN